MISEYEIAIIDPSVKRRKMRSQDNVWNHRWARILKESLTQEERNRMNFLIYAFTRFNKGIVPQNEIEIILVVKEYSELK